MNHNFLNSFNMSTRSRNGQYYMSTTSPYDTKMVSSDHLGQDPNQAHGSLPHYTPSSHQAAADCFNANQLLHNPADHCIPTELLLHNNYYLATRTPSYQQVPTATYNQYQLHNYIGPLPLPYDVAGLNNPGLPFDEGVYGYGPILSTNNASNLQDSLLYDGSRESSVLSSAFSAATAHIWSPVLSVNESVASPSETEYASFTTSPMSMHEDINFTMDTSAINTMQPHQSMDHYVYQPMNDTTQYIQPMPYEPPTLSAMFASPLPSSPLSTISTPSTISMVEFNWTAPIVSSSTRQAKKSTSTSGRSTIKKTTRQPRKPTTNGPTFRVQKPSKPVVKKEPKDWELAVVELHLEGYTYEQIRKMIKEKYGEEKAVSSLRGTKRNIVVPKELRPRSPKWEVKHIEAMFEGIPLATVKSGNKYEVRWTLVSQYILEKTNRAFGPNNVHAMYDVKVEENAAAAEREAARPFGVGVGGFARARL